MQHYYGGCSLNPEVSKGFIMTNAADLVPPAGGEGGGEGEGGGLGRREAGVG